jgi:2-hydroxychromene-2-carboxylate isomerase
MRVCCALEADQPALQRFSQAAFNAYFADGQNIDAPEVLISVADQCGLDGQALVSQTAEQHIKDQLRANTEEAIKRGAYGSPTMFVGESLYFGNDQLPLVEQALKVAP